MEQIKSRVPGLDFLKRIGSAIRDYVTKPEDPLFLDGPEVYDVDDRSWSATGRAPYDLSTREVYEVLADLPNYYEVARQSLRDQPVPED